MIDNIKKYLREHRLLSNGISMLLAFSMVTLMAIAVGEKMNSGVKAFRVNIDYEDSTKKLVNEDYIKEELRKELGYDVDRLALKDLDLLLLERFFNNNSYIKNAEVFIDAHNVIVANITQKNPIVRVMGEDADYYLDMAGDYLPISSVAAVRVPVVTGEIGVFNTAYREDEEGNLFKDIYTLALTIQNDDFLRILIEQIHIENSHKILLIPKLGKEKIIIGEVAELEDKIYKIKRFYKEGLTRVGWGKYAYLDLRNEGQVTAVRN